MKKLLFTFAFLLFTFYLFAQADLGLPVATGKGGAANGIVKDWECIGINPANLGWENNYRFSISPLIFGISIQSKALDYATIKQAALDPNKKFTKEEKQNYVTLFSKDDGLNLQSNINWLAFSFAIPKVGGFALNLRDRSFGHISLNPNASDVLFNGTSAKIFKDTSTYTKLMSEIFDGTRISFMDYRELNLSYGRKLFGIGGTKDSSAVSVYGGFGFKYLWGMANFEMIAENGKLNRHSSMSSKFGIDYRNMKNFTPENSTGMFDAVGSGTAWDFGAGIGIRKMKITFSATDIGKINWGHNVLVAVDIPMPDTSKMNYSGIESWNILEQVNKMFNDSGIVQFKSGSDYETELSSKLRIGAGYQFSKWIVVGADMIMPMNDNPTNLSKAYYALGTEIGLASNFKFSFGFTGNSQYKFAMPFGVTIGRFAKIFEIRVATNDILTHITKGAEPNISIALSLFRFNLEPKK